MKKFTTATLKSILKNKDCFIQVTNCFDSTTDCIQTAKGGFRKINKNELNLEKKYTLGISGLWLVGSSRDFFTLLNENTVEISNCCGVQRIRFA